MRLPLICRQVTAIPVDMSIEFCVFRQPEGVKKEASMIGKRLKQLRMAQGLSLEGLAASLGGIVTKQALSKYETGKAQPTVRVLTQLAEALKVKSAHLFEEPSIRIEKIAFRRKSRLRKREEEQVESMAHQELEQRVRLQRMCFGESKLKIPIRKYRVQSVEDTEAAAEGLRKEWDLGADPIASMTGTLEDRRVHVIGIQAGESFDGLSLVAYDGSQVVAAATVSRSGLPGERQRLNLAHELGHLVLDIDEAVNEEKAAFRFGGALLAPREVLRREVGSRRRSIGLTELLLLKQRFGLSIQALIHRLFDLEIISEPAYKEWWISLNRLGYRKKEPGEMSPETPQWLKRTVYFALAEGLMESEEAEMLLHEKVDLPAPASLVERRAFMKLPLEERRRLMAKQAEKLAAVYEEDTEWKQTQGGDILEY